STVAGNGKKGYGGDGGKAAEAMLRGPKDCCLDAKGGVLIADGGDWRGGRVGLEKGDHNNFAGTGKGQEEGPQEVGAWGGGSGGGRGRKAVVVGARGVCVDRLGNTYLCEREGNAIRRVDSKGIITTVAGTGKSGYGGDGGPPLQATFKGPKGVRCDRTGNVYV